ncbi:E3 ubiquitin-protein ligase Siah1-like isoform X2 [Paramacrobiotus metropolitanus]|nr:E3 ubiquitin-protein ligase Siah1-like isoform X2 [Paramacrobiotus metropolitanus]
MSRRLGYSMPHFGTKPNSAPPPGLNSRAENHQMNSECAGGALSSLSNGAPLAIKNEDLIGHFECPVCFDYAVPPLLQCHSGHLVCQLCREKLSCCPSCRGPIGSVRNLAMEKVAATLVFPCRFSNSGCTQTMGCFVKLKHEEVCDFRPYTCPCPGAGCNWNGPLEQVTTHLKTAHSSITTLQGEDIVFLATDISLPGAVDWVMMQTCFNHHFILILEKQDRNDGCVFYAVVYFVGNRKDAEKFAYKLELGGDRRKLTWEATPISILDGVNANVFSRDCVMFEEAIAKQFAENGNLGINVAITTFELLDANMLAADDAMFD